MGARTLEELAKMVWMPLGRQRAEMVQRYGRDVGQQIVNASDVICPFFTEAGVDEGELYEAEMGNPDLDEEDILRFLGILNNTDRIRNVVLRLADPLEHAGDEGRLQIAHENLNRLLRAEGYQVEMQGVRPVITEVNADFSSATKEMPPSHVSARAIILPEQIADGEVKQALAFWKNEYQKCADAGAYLASVVLLGAMLEATLLLAIKKNPKDVNQCAAAPKRNGGVKPFDEWTMSEMIDVARACKWISVDAKLFGHGLRNYRNFIHPGELEKNESPDKGVVEIGCAVVQKTLDELARKVPLG